MEKRIARDTLALLALGDDGFSATPGAQERTYTVAFDAPGNSPYAGVPLALSYAFSCNHPFEPPLVAFRTPVPHHPNIDLATGAVCLDILRRPPGGSWAPTVGPRAVLEAVRLLLCEPNADDPLNAEAAREMRVDMKSYIKSAQTSVGVSSVLVKRAACATVSPLNCETNVVVPSEKSLLDCTVLESPNSTSVGADITMPEKIIAPLPTFPSSDPSIAMSKSALAENEPSDCANSVHETGILKKSHSFLNKRSHSPPPSHPFDSIQETTATCALADDQPSLLASKRRKRAP